MLEKNLNQDSINEQVKIINEVINSYEVSRLTILEIARKYNLTYHTVRKILIDNDIKIRPRNSK